VRTSIESFQELASLVWHPSWPGFQDCEKWRRKCPWIATEYNWLAEDYKTHSQIQDSFAYWSVGDFAFANKTEKEMSEAAKGFVRECKQKLDDDFSETIGIDSSETESSVE
jgi:hypothetical protein